MAIVHFQAYRNSPTIAGNRLFR